MKTVRMVGLIPMPVSIRPRNLPRCERNAGASLRVQPSVIISRHYAEHKRVLKNGFTGQHASVGRSLPRTCRALSSIADIETSVGLLVEGNPNIDNSELNTLVEQLYEDARVALQHATVVAMGINEADEDSAAPGPLELSIVLCDDDHIQDLNREWRGVDSPTDVLSFEMGGDFDFEDDEEFINAVDREAELDTEEVNVEDFEDNMQIRSEDVEEWDEEGPAQLDGDELNIRVATDPAMILGDVVISIDTARKQADSRGYSLRDECRVLLIHGILHLLGYDHEHGRYPPCNSIDSQIIFSFSAVLSL